MKGFPWDHASSSVRLHFVYKAINQSKQRCFERNANINMLICSQCYCNRFTRFVFLTKSNAAAWHHFKLCVSHHLCWDTQLVAQNVVKYGNLLPAVALTCLSCFTVPNTAKNPTLVQCLGKPPQNNSKKNVITWFYLLTYLRFLIRQTTSIRISASRQWL